ncbi:hypothetical protein [Roseibium album]|uniref:GAP1-N1 domain-containing protein n=1 Tax=Roseibium album TaxID=311410 RepID=UPI003919762A
MTSIIHQALHGYSDGHRLISSSVQIQGMEARIMQVMSDLSGPGVKPEPSGYITGYPLESAGKYVLARTWAAPEMSRPGCVWTHSLIIDNADLAAFTSAKSLLSAFRRPTGASSKHDYADPASIFIAPSQPFTLSQDRAQEIINALYALPDRTILAEVEEADKDEQLISAIWMQQWPRLRRAFGFCTLSGMDRSGKGVLLDLQLVRTLDRQIIAKFPNSVAVSKTITDKALKPLFANAEGQDSTQIREFLRRAGGDVDGGRRAMVPLCRLYSSLFEPVQPDLTSAVDALGDLALFGPQQARSVRTLIVRKAIEQIGSLDDEVFDFVLSSLEQTVRSNDKAIAVERIAEALWLRSPVRFIKAIDSGDIVGQASEQTLKTMDPRKLIAGLQDNPQLAKRVTHARPELLELSDFWSIAGIDENLVTTVNATNTGRVAAALLMAGKAGSTLQIIERVDSNELAGVLVECSRESSLDAWLCALIGMPDKAAAVLASGSISARSILVGLARVSDPDTLPNDFGEDPWLIAVHSAKTLIEQSDEEYLAAYLMSRALGYRSRSQAELIRFSFTILYRAFEQDRLHWDVERLVKWRLDRGGWFSWDNCSRLRATIVSHFIDRKLDPEIFGRLTDDDNLARDLLSEAAQTSRGRRYLREVRKQLKNAEENSIRARAEYIASQIN